MVVASAVGAVGPGADLPRARGRQGRGAREQGDARDGGRADARAREGDRRAAPADRQRALRAPPVPRRPPARGRAAAAAHGLGRALPQPARARASRAITREEALAHPTWRMGPKITIDSATLMNKGLEVIEARWLFGVPAAQDRRAVHPQSVVHSLVEFVDGTVLAQLGVTDMRMPIQYALSYPERWPAAIPGIDFTQGAAARVRAARPREVPLPRRSPTARSRQAARRRRCSTPRTRWPWPRSSTARSLPSASPRRSSRSSTPSRRAPAATLEDVLEADRRARERARQALARRTPARVHS